MNTIRRGTPIALLLAGALALTGCDGTPRSSQDPQGPGTIEPAADDSSPTTSPEHLDWRVREKWRVDLDGDGTKDQVRMRKPRGFHKPYEIQLVGELSDGSVSAVMRRHHPFPAFMHRADIDGRPGQELFVLEEGPPRIFTVFTWRDGSLVELKAPEDQPVTDDYFDQHAFAWWTQDGSLWTSRSVPKFEFGYDTVTTPDRYRVRAWRWTVRGTDLVPHDQGVFCVTADDATTLQRC